MKIEEHVQDMWEPKHCLCGKQYATVVDCDKHVLLVRVLVGLENL